MPQKIAPFLMFTGLAEAAMQFYAATFAKATIRELQRFGPGEAGTVGTVKKGTLMLGELEVMCFDSPPVHAFTFTPSISLFVTCESEAEIDALAPKLADGGATLMPLDTYPFSRKYAWVVDRFGVAWQLNLP